MTEQERLIQLQLFAGGQPDDTVETPPVETAPVETQPVVIPEGEPTEEQPEGTEPPEGSEEQTEGQEDQNPEGEELEGKDKPNAEQDRINNIVQQRLARQQRQFEREMSRAAGVPLSMQDISQAAQLWGYLAQNPQVAQQVQQILNQTYNPNSRNPVSERMAELDIRETIMELRAEDPIFRKHENEIQAWANQQGIRIQSGKDVELVYNAWKGQNYRRDMANAELQAQRKLQQNLKSKAKAAVIPARPSRVTPKLDYAKMSPADILRAEGLKLFTPDE